MSRASVATVGTALARARARLTAAGVASPALDARLLVAAVLGCDVARLIGHPDAEIDAEAAARLQALVERRAAREPVALILGRRAFWTLELAVTRDTLVPRPDSETVIEAALARIDDRRAPLRVLDLGTGSGCLLLALLAELPAADGLGVDCSEAALAVARSNAEATGLGARAMFARGDWADAVGGRFDVVVANPPYLTTAELALLPADVGVYEPRAALAGGADGLDAYRRILSELPRLLRRDGCAHLEIDPRRAATVSATAVHAGLQPLEITHDLAGMQRCLSVSAGASPSPKKTLGNQSLPD